jgi:hypothetical protein
MVVRDGVVAVGTTVSERGARRHPFGPVSGASFSQQAEAGSMTGGVGQ